MCLYGVMKPGLIISKGLLLVVSAALQFGCTNQTGEGEAQTILAGETEEWQELEINHAQNFTVAYHDDYKVVQLHYRSDLKEIDFTQKIVLVPKGKQAPALEGDLAGAWKIDIPVKSVAANEDGEITRLRHLGLIDRIVGMGGGGIYDQELRQRWENKQIASIGYSFHAIPQPELLMSANAELLVLHTYDHSRLEGMQKLRELGINAIPQFSWAEQSFLAKAEWIKFTSLFYNKEREAMDLFNQIESRCNELMQMVENESARVTSFLLYHPSNVSDWNAHRNDFYASYLQAVSSNVLQDDGPTHSVGISNEQLLALAGEADFWITNSREDTKWPPASYLKSFKAYRNQNVYHYQKRTNYENDAYDWYETPEVRPDLVLEDLVSIFYPHLLPNHEPIFLARVKLTKE